MDGDERVSEVERLLAAAATDGRVELGVLTDDEECVLGAGRWAWTDATVWRAWMAGSDDDRAAATDAVVRSLTSRGLVTEVHDTADSLHLDLSARAGLIQAARQQPFFVVTAITAPVLAAPLGYGLVDEVAGLRGVVVELRHDGLHDYRLLSVEHAAAGLAAWAHDAVTTDRWGARCETVVLEVLRHREGESLQAAAVTAEAPESSKDGMVLSFGGHRLRLGSEDPETVAAGIEQLLRQAAEPVRSPR